ncbi:MAG: aminopeptidase P family protein [Dehalococcoidales bacterium]|nr:aminopeptidase P family protein [Dehalococcoidales bacterium]
MSKYIVRPFGGPEAVDWSVRINTARMREERLAKARASLKKHGIAACLLMRPENMRYVTSTKAVNFIDQLRYTVAFAEHDPIVYELPPGNLFGDCPWVKPENLKLAILWADEACGPAATWERAQKFARSIKQDLKEKGLEKEKLGVDKLDEPAQQALREAGIETVDVMTPMLEARAVKTEDEIYCMMMAVAISEVGWYALYDALKPGVLGRELIAVANKAMYSAGAEDVWGVLGGARNTGIVQVGDVITVDFCRITYLGYNTCYYRNIICGRKPNQKEKDLHKRSYERVHNVIEAIKPGVSTAEVAKHWLPAKERGYPTEEYTWCEDLAHGLGLWLYEYPTINRLWSFDYPMTLEKGMCMAVEAMEFDPSVGRTKLEEMIVVGDEGAEIMTKMPVEDLMIASPIITA